MARPLFSDMLFDRRRQLGLSIKQASNVLRLKEEVLIAFEEGDFESIPKSGYAQGMLSSYARYLGLNAKTVVNQFSQDLFEYERGASSHEARRRGRQNRSSDDGPLYETPQAMATQGRSKRTYVESRGFLPTSGGFAGDLGEFATTSDARPRYRSTGSYSSDDSGYSMSRPYTSRVPYSQPGSTPLTGSQRPRTSGGARSYYDQDGMYGSGGGRHLVSAYPQASGYYPPVRDDITTRRVSPSQYRDDMRLDNDGVSYQSASSASGRRSSRNIASTERPNVQRRSRRTRESASRRGREPEHHGGIVGMIEVFLSDRSRVMALIIAVVVAVITCVIIFSVQSCVSTRRNTGRSVPVTSTDTSEQTDADETEAANTVTSEEEERARAEAAAAKAAETDASSAVRTFDVSVDEGEVIWIEIECDGKSDVAETVTGPWKRTYTVRQAISISVSDTTGVTVTENGKKLEFESKASGIGTITIQVAKKSDLDAANATDAAANGQTTTTPNTTDANGQPVTTETQDTTSGEAGQTDQQDSGTEGTAADQNTDKPTEIEGYVLAEDGNYYGDDGYLDPDGAYHPY